MPEGALLTYEDLASFPDDGLRRELIDGELIVSPSPRTRHQRISARLHLVLANHVNATGAGEVFYAPFDVVFSPTNVVEPDLLFIPTAQRAILTEMNVQGAPALVIEILSDARLDRDRKRKLYARFGVSEYWIVDPEGDRVEVYKIQRRGYARPVILGPGDALTTALLPGLAIDLAALLAR